MTRPPPSPCRTRAASSVGTDVAMAHSSDPARNSAMANSHTRRAPKRSVAQPVIGMTDAKASRYAVATHCTVATVAPSSRPRTGSATLTTVASRIVRTEPRTTTTASQRSSGVRAGVSTERSSVVVMHLDVRRLIVRRQMVSRLSYDQRVRPTRTPIGLQLASTAKVVSRAFDDALATAGGSRPEWLVLLAIKTRQVTSQRDLAVAVGIQGATLTHHLHAMEQSGLVTRERDPANRRVQFVVLTPSGEEAFLRLRTAA